MKNIIITGATSMLGTALADAILESEDDAKIFAVVRPKSSNLYRLSGKKNVEIIECEAENYEKLSSLITEKCDVFYHIAWTSTGVNRNKDSSMQCKNIEYTLDALECAKKLGCKKFVGTGSQAEYGLLDVEKISPETPVNPIQPYGIAKYAAGRLAMQEAKKDGMDFFWVRVFSVFGEYDLPTTMISSTIAKLKSGEKPSFTPATQRWDYLYSKDAGEALYLIGKKSIGQKVYCLGSGEARPLCEYIYELRDIVAPGAELGIGDIAFAPGTVMNICADISSLTEDTGWKPKYSFKDGIKNMLILQKSYS